MRLVGIFHEGRNRRYLLVRVLISLNDAQRHPPLSAGALLSLHQSGLAEFSEVMGSDAQLCGRLADSQCRFFAFHGCQSPWIPERLVNGTGAARSGSVKRCFTPTMVHRKTVGSPTICRTVAG